MKRRTLAFNIQLNAAHNEVALGALARELGGPVDDRDARRERARVLLKAVDEAFPGFRCFWNTSFGMRLQNIDSEICGRVLRTLREAAIPALSVHDSFIVPVQHRGALLDVMKQAFELELHRKSTMSPTHL
jgi:hypothetical protein